MQLPPVEISKTKRISISFPSWTEVIKVPDIQKQPIQLLKDVFVSGWSMGLIKVCKSMVSTLIVIFNKGYVAVMYSCVIKYPKNLVIKIKAALFYYIS